MSLDMYLSANKAVVLYKNGVPFKWKEEGESVGYWNFDPLHTYIMNNFRYDEDVCDGVDLNETSVEQILGVLHKVDQDHSLAPTLLPLYHDKEGNTVEYNDIYFDDITYSIEVFTNGLEFLEEHRSVEVECREGKKISYSSLVYRASW